MFEFFRKHTRVLQFVLVLLIFPSFVFFGVQGYSQFATGGNKTIGEVAGQRITQPELDAAHRELVEQRQREMPNVESKFFDNPEIKRQALDKLVLRRVLRAAASQLNLVTTDERLVRRFVSDPQYASFRNSDGSIDQDALARNGLSSEMFELRLRQEMTASQVLSGIVGTALSSANVAATAFDALLQQREVQVLRFEAKDYTSKVSPSDEELQKFYDDPVNSGRFTIPERVSIEYVVLDLETLKNALSVSENDLRNYYSENAARYTTPEERRASHILIKADKQLPAATRTQAKAKAEGLLAELKINPEAFAEIARKSSEDPGSAVQGGDLGFFGRGAMVKPFEDTVFSLRVDEISSVIESDFGYHIIQLVALRGGVQRPFKSVQSEIENEIKHQLAQQQYAEAAVEFTNTAYEQPDSLQPLLDKLKLKLQTAQDVERTPSAGTRGPLASRKFVEALFAGDVRSKKHNTEAIEIAVNQMAAGRVVNYTSAHRLPFSQVKPMVYAKVAAAQAAEQAHREGLARLARVQQLPGGELSAPRQTISRAQAHDLPATIIDAVLRADTKKLPSVIGIDLGAQGYAVVKLLRVLERDPAESDPAQVVDQYAQAWSAAETQAYYNALKTRLEVDLSAAAAQTSDEE